MKLKAYFLLSLIAAILIISLEVLGNSGIIINRVAANQNMNTELQFADSNNQFTSQPSRFRSLSKIAKNQVEIVAQLSERPGNLAITPDGRIIMSLHPFGKPKYKVLELLPDGTTKPFPNSEWGQSPNAEGVGFGEVIGIESDRNGFVWMLDKGVNGSTPRLIAWDTRKNELVRVINIPAPVFQPNSFMQDLAVDIEHQAVYIADMSRGDLIGVSNPAIVFVDLKTGKARRALENHQSLQPEGANFFIDGKVQTVSNTQGELVRPDLGLNPITIDAKNEWIYYGAMNGRSLYRVRTKDLLNQNFSSQQIGSRVSRYGDKPVSDGISIDNAGNVYVTDVNANAVGVTMPNGNYRILYQDVLLSWVDGISYGADGYFYATVNQLHRHPVLNGGKDGSKPPYLIVRFKPLAPGTIGR
jgi:DNA-binding beta-propeller fold protein YncE